MNIVVVDDHTIVRKGICQLLSEQKDLHVVGEAGDFEQVFELIEKRSVDIVILDINLPGRNGLDVLTQLQHDHPHISVLILTMYPEEQYAIRAIKSGADGYLTKDSVPEELINAVLTIRDGNKFISKTLAGKLASYINRSQHKQPHENLSNREFQIMIMIASGKTLKEIASELFLSIKTISTYKSRLFEKMGFVSNLELVQYVTSNNLHQTKPLDYL